MTPESSLSWNQTTEGWSVYFTGGKTAEEIKLHSTWDERDADYSPVDRSTFSALVKNIFEVSFTAGGKESFWTYDAKGNRLSETERTVGIYSPVQRVTYYPNTDLIKQYGEWYFNYDQNGSQTSRGKTAAENPSVEEPFASWIFDASDGEVWYYEYDLSGRMTKSSSSKKGTDGLTERASYAYDYRGLLVKKTYAEFTADEGVSITGGSTVKVTEWYEYTQDGRLLYTEKSAGSVTTKKDYIWAETTLWCEVDDGEVYYHHTDHLGTTEAVTDSKGKVVWHAEYEAFGSVLSENGRMAFTPSFTGKMMDDCSGLYYFNARWYDSECGRFITQDPARDGGNWYAYCGNNPLVFTDRNGLWFGADDVFTGPIDEILVFGGITIFTAVKIYNSDANKNFSEALSDVFTENINKFKEHFSKNKNDSKAKSNTNTEASAGIPSPNQNDQDNDDKNEKKYENQTAKDAKKLDNKGADTFSKERGFKDAHDLKREYLKGQKDTTVGHYDIKVNSKTGEAFLVNKSGTVTVMIE